MGKAKLSVTLDVNLLEEIDRCVEARAKYRSRSAVIEDAVKVWLRAKRTAEARAYYENQSEEERDSEQAWAEAAAASMALLYDAD